MGDTAVSFHTLGEGVFVATQKSKSQALTKFSFPEGGRSSLSRIGILGKMNQKFCKRKLGPASQIVSHTLRVETKSH